MQPRTTVVVNIRGIITAHRRLGARRQCPICISRIGGSLCDGIKGLLPYPWSTLGFIIGIQLLSSVREQMAPPSRPTTPLRPSSRTSLRDSQSFTPGGSTSSAFPLDSLEPAFAELSDSMADLEANFMHLQLMHESLSRFNENFASFLYGLNMNAFCVDFPEVSTRQLFLTADTEADSSL